MSLVKAHRTHGHLAARLDPLGSEPPGDPALDPDRLEPRLTPDLMARIPASVLRLYVKAETLVEALPVLRETYCGTMAFELEHISSHEQRLWLREAIESGTFRRPFSPEEKKALLGRLSDVEGFERYLRRAFLGQKQFSIEGLDVMVPMLDEAIELAADDGARRVVLGMAHRGRLNVLAHTVGREVDAILREFEGERVLEAVSADLESGSGDVKYHLGAEGVRETPSGEVTVSLVSNPSHLEFVDPVVEGETRASQTDHGSPAGEHDPAAALAILIHGDAAFPGQGVVAETLNLQELAGYRTGGTLHIIANNQVGLHDRSRRGPLDPLLERPGQGLRHADRARERRRPRGGRLGDPPGHGVPCALPPRRRRRPRRLPALRPQRGRRAELHAAAHVQADRGAPHGPRAVRAAGSSRTASSRRKRSRPSCTTVQERMRAVHEELKASFATGGRRKERRIGRGADTQLDTAVPAEQLEELNERLLQVPEGFTVHPKLAKALERRRDTLGEQGGIDWAQAEGLAFGTLLADATPVRLTGQDTERGTFSHRHLVLHDYETGEKYAPIQHLPSSRAPFQVYNSPLSETGALGFEYGYSVAVSRALVLWEAQFGDFVNSAQVVIDQFVVSGLSKWTQSSRLTLLLPHGYEGNGPEHSSARLERFMQLAAQENIRIVNPSTAAQYFHLLRRQALHPKGRPLVVLTPKGLLRHKEATSHLEELSQGGFRAVIDDPRLDADEKREISRLVLCTGKVYYDIVGHEAFGEAEGVAVARLEQLYPFPVAAYDELLSRYPSLTEVVWSQEEPQNMGAWRAIRHRLEEGLPAEVDLRYVGRPWRASPSEGYPTAHMLEQDRIAREALGAF